MKNLALENIDITSVDNIGGIVGYINGILKNSRSECSVAGKWFVGGIAGNVSSYTDFNEAVVNGKAGATTAVAPKAAATRTKTRTKTLCLPLEDIKPDTKPELPFTDVKEADWFADSVRWAHENGLMTGTSSTGFAPHTFATRGMIVTILHRPGGSGSADTDNPFSDASAGYYADADAWAVGNNIVSGYGNSKFGPDDSITRGQLAVILMNYAKFKGYEVSANADLSGFQDSSSISEWAGEAMAWANAIGFINEKGGVILDPGGNATRAELAVILQRFVEYISR